MKISPDLTSQYTGDQIDPINGERLRRLKINSTTTAKEEIHRQREERIYNQNNGHSIITTFGSKMRRDWIWTKHGLKVGD